MLYIINKDTKDLKAIESASFQELKLWERKDLEKWVEKYPRILGEELFVITTEYDKFDKSGDRLDVLAIDQNGKLVIIELKRDIAPTETELQAVKYASICSNFTFKDIIEIYVDHMRSKGSKVDEEEARNEILEYIQNESFEDLDNQPRIILAAREFRQESLSSVLWLRSFGVDITCVKLELHSLKSETGTDTIAVNSSIIIPLPDAKEFVVDRERKETEIAEMTKSQKFYRSFYDALITRFRQECPGITERGGTKDSWLGLPVGYTGIHFEWWFRKRPKKFFEVGLHLEKSNYEENKKILSEIEKSRVKLEKEIQESLVFDYEFGQNWCRLYVANDNVEDLDKLKSWIIETTKKFYTFLKPKLDEILA